MLTLAEFDRIPLATCLDYGLSEHRRRVLDSHGITTIGDLRQWWQTPDELAQLRRMSRAGALEVCQACLNLTRAVESGEYTARQELQRDELAAQRLREDLAPRPDRPGGAQHRHLHRAARTGRSS